MGHDAGLAHGVHRRHWEPFLRAGTQHMFAIDGLRVALVSGMVVVLLRLRGSRAWRAGWSPALIIWFYTAATGWEASALRASVMMTVILGGWALKRPGDLLNSLAAAALIILLIDPRQMLQASFLLSFCVVLVIALVLPPLNAIYDHCIERWLGPDPLLPAVLVPAWRQELVWCARQVAHFCALSFVAWLGCLPLAAKFFHLFSPVSTLANVFAVPCGAAALMANLGALVCGDWLPGLTVLFNHAAWLGMVAMTWVSVKTARVARRLFLCAGTVAGPRCALLCHHRGRVLRLVQNDAAKNHRRRHSVSHRAWPISGSGNRPARKPTSPCCRSTAATRSMWMPPDAAMTGSSIAAAKTPSILRSRIFCAARASTPCPGSRLSDANARNCGGAMPRRRTFSHRRIMDQRPEIPFSRLSHRGGRL